MTPTVSLWMTESSLIDWEDTIALEAHLPASRWPQFLREALGDGLDLRYEGLVDDDVHVGGAQVSPTSHALHVEPDWVVLFDQPLRSLSSITADTPCVLQGMAEGRWLEPLAEADTPRWATVTRGNNLLARGKGIPTTIGAIQRHEHEVAAARSILHIPLANGETRTRVLNGGNLADLPLLEIVREVQDFARAHTERAGQVSGVAIGATGEAHAYMNGFDPIAALPVAAYLPQLFRTLLHEAGGLSALLDRARRQTHQELLTKAEYLRPAAPLLLSVLDSTGAPVGEGALVVEDQAVVADEKAGKA